MATARNSGQKGSCCVPVRVLWATNIFTLLLLLVAVISPPRTSSHRHVKSFIDASNTARQAQLVGSASHAAAARETVATPPSPPACASTAPPPPCVCDAACGQSNDSTSSEPFYHPDVPSKLLSEKRVIAYSLYAGRASLEQMNRYLLSLTARKEEAKRNFARWTTRLYLDGAFTDEFAAWLESLGWEVVRVPPLPADTQNWFRMATRLQVVDDVTVDRFLIRDIDTALSVRDMLAVTYWIESERPLLSMRDSGGHNIAMMGGMWGGRRAQIARLLGSSMASLMEGWRTRGVNDQEFMLQVILPRVRPHMLSMDATKVWCPPDGPRCVDFPTFPQEVSKNYVGRVAYEESDGVLSEATMLYPYDCADMAAKLKQLNIFGEGAAFNQSQWRTHMEAVEKKCAEPHRLFWKKES